MSAVVVVESPAKAKTIEGYLGPGYTVLASYGHIRDLRKKEGAVDPNDDFAMHYEVPADSEKNIKAILTALKGADTLYLATDLDREGEAISWHVWEEVKKRAPKVAGNLHVHRIAFSEITKSAISKAIQNPRELALNLINAQQARRALDYLVGYTLSPVLWRKVRGGLSAGRVQSVALRLICEREIAIEAFTAEEYWTLQGTFTTAGNKPLTANLSLYQGQKVEKFSFTNAATAHAAQAALQPMAFSVAALEKTEKRRFPAPPFITSTLQQEAARKLGFAARRTMQAAQRLYEAGHITYMRTDAVNLANESVAALRATIGKEYGADHLPAQPIVYKNKSKNAQEAHEAIRPTDPAQKPANLRLEDDQARLYALIWQRTIACQMVPARLEQTTITLMDASRQNAFRATGSVIVFAGFLAVYQEGRDDDAADDDDDKILPAVQEGEKLTTKAVTTEQHFTEPPPRFSEASLIKALEELGIGRPSTYASIISTIQDRGYVRLDKKRFFPEDIGRVVNKFLTQHFGQYVDFHFTANLEDDLDAIARGEHDWKPTLRAFWQPFKALIDDKMESVKKSDVTTEATGEACPTCQVGELVFRLGKYGTFKGCNRYPECTYIEKTGPAGGGPVAGEPTGVPCPSCLAPGAELAKKTSRYGKIFYSCNTYPTCTYACWDAPIQQACPSCGWKIVTQKSSKKYGEWLKCPNCGWGDNADAAAASAAFKERMAGKGGKFGGKGKGKYPAKAAASAPAAKAAKVVKAAKPAAKKGIAKAPAKPRASVKRAG